MISVRIGISRHTGTLLILPLLWCAQLSVRAQEANFEAPTPPIGWNSWDSYGTTVNEV